MIKNIFTALLLIISSTSFCQSFTAIWNTNNTETGSSANDQIKIPTNPSFTYNYTIDWGDSNTDTGATGDIIHTYSTPGIYTISISGDFPAIYFNEDGDKLKIIEILDWGTIQWQTMENAFYGCENINFDAIDAPDLSQVTSLKNMFRGCTNFNGIVNNWDISTITDISGLFAECEIFNRPLNDWNTVNVTDMSYVFHRARLFNEPLDNWNTASVNTMEYLFSETTSFDQNINNWDVSQVTTMFGTFRYTSNFNKPLNSWNITNVTNMASMFQGSSFNQNLNSWIVSNVTSMAAMFRESKFNYPIENWDVSKVTDMSYMFHRHRTFNHPLNNWNVSSVTNMASMFDGWLWGAIFNQPLDNWNVSNVTDMNYMFRDNSAFNQDISGWNVSNVTNMLGMFSETDAFNQPLEAWDVSNVTNMANMFDRAVVFNQPLNNWIVSNVEDTSVMFSNATAFNQPLNLWTLSKVTDFQNMFSQAISFDQNISAWNTTLGTKMNGMFNGASSFDQNIGSWDISSVNNMSNMLSNSGISQENYDTILIAWSGQTVNSGINLGATNLQYCDALTQRQSLIDDNGWNITGDDVNCSYVLCTEITMPHANDIATPANSDIRWNPAPNATGYYVTLEVVRGSVRSYVNIDGTPANNFDVGNIVGLDFTNEFATGDTVYVTVVPYNDEGPATGCPETSFTVADSWANSLDAFKITIDTRNLNTNSSNANQYRLDLYASLTYDFNIDWGDGQYDNNVDTSITHTYLIPGEYTIAIIGVFPSFYHSSSNRDNLKLISMDQWGTQVWQSMDKTFYFCENMEYNATDIPDLSQVTSMQSMFRRVTLFNTDINNWDVGNVTDMGSLFYQAYIFNQPLHSWDVSNVTDMHNMFNTASDFNQPLDAWDVGNVTNMNHMFNSAKAFNQSLNSWNVGNIVDMNSMFNGAEVFNQPLDTWSVGNVETMEDMFNSAKAFNQNIDSWIVTNVTSMKGMFQNANVFNQPLNSWDVSSVTNMNSMFSSATAFNQPLNNWDVDTVTDMSLMFRRANTFNQNINSWNVTNVISMQSMFNDAINFDMPVNDWEVNSVVNMSSMFSGAEVFNQPLSLWDVSAVANMSNMFEDALLFNQLINTWNVSSVTLMESMFEDAYVFNQLLNNWDTSVVTNFNAMFKNALVFNEPLSNWVTREAVDMAEMFSGAGAFNQDLDSWNVSYVTTMQDMFKGASVFNQNLDSWNVASVTTMQGMFQNAFSFDGVIGSWNVRGVTTMQDMLNGATTFNQPINNWRVTGVTNMNNMFQGASTFNQPFNLWNLGSVSMRNMFHDATSFNQYLGDWDISGVTNMQNMLDDTALIRENYDNTLIAWSEQNLTPGINLGAANLPYCDAVEERQAMIDNFGWSVTGDILDCPIPECTQLTSPLNGDTGVPVNTNLTWEPVLYAREYRLTVGTSPGGNDIVDNETIINDTNYEFTSDFSGGETIYVTIVPSNENGDAVGPCTEESFIISTTVATIPDCTSSTLPINGDTDVAVDTDFNWNAISNADGYKLSIGTTPGGIDIFNNDVNNVTNYNLNANLPEDTTIYVTVTPYNDLGDANICTEESFTTELIPTPPACTNLINPLNGATNTPIDTNLSWTAVDGATGYLVVVGTTQGGVETVNNVDVLNATTYNIPDDLLPNRTYYVTIIPYNKIGDAIGCVEESFRTGAGTLSDPPACTTLITPLNNAIDVPVDTNISWNAAANVTGYKLTIGTMIGGSNILNEDVGNVTTFNLTNNLPENTTVYITIIPYNAFGDAIGCSEESFITEVITIIPTCTQITAPVDGSNNVLVSTNLTWNSSANATGYWLSIRTSTGTYDLFNNLDVGNTTSYDFVNDLPQNTTFYVHVDPYNATGSTTGCTEQFFTTETVSTVPNCTTLISPLNGAINVAIDTDISWNAVSNADGYLITLGTTSGGNDILVETDVTNTSYNLPDDLAENIEIFATIIPYNSIGNAIGCTSENFTTEIVSTVPNCTTLISPLNGATNVAIDTDISWNAVSIANGYLITIGTTSGGDDILTNENIGLSTSYSLNEDLLFNTTFYVSITPYNGVGDAIGCQTTSFTTEAEPLVESEYGFSPNGDGINDFWEIKGIENSPQNTVNIYNRWGDLVFTITNYNNQANVFRGEANRLTKVGASSLPNGTYFFDIQITGSHNLKKLKGFLVLKR